jgi:hypothetical protein
MLKPFTLSLSLAVALGLCSVSKAGLFDGKCATCGLASPQGGVAPSAQGGGYGCAQPCAPKHHWNFHLPKLQHSCSYEWVLKKKKVWGHNAPCGNTGCNECGGAPAVYPTGQAAPSAQTYAAPQYTAPTAAGQTTYYRPAVGEMRPALAADEVPPAPTIATGGSSLLPLAPSGN